MLGFVLPVRGERWSVAHSLAWVVLYYVVTVAISRVYLEAEYARTGSVDTAIVGGHGLAHLLLLLAIILVVARKADAGQTAVLASVVLGVVSVLPILTWGAWAAIVALLTAEGLDWPLNRRPVLAATTTAPPHPEPFVDPSQLGIGQRVRFWYRDKSTYEGVRGLILSMTLEDVVIRSDTSGSDVRVRFDNVEDFETLLVPDVPAPSSSGPSNQKPLDQEQIVPSIQRQGSLVDRLAQLDAARAARLVTAAEHATKRRSILEQH